MFLFSKSRSFRVHILTVFLSIISITCALIIWYSYSRTSKSIKDLASETIERTSELVIARVDDVVTDMERVDKMATNFFLHAPTVGPNSTELFADMIDLVRYYSYVDSLYYGLPNGNFYRIIDIPVAGLTKYVYADTPLPPGTAFAIHVLEWSQNPPFEKVTYLDADKKELASEIHPNPTFDPRVRPWYKGAVETKGIFWTDLYMYELPYRIGISVGDPMYDAQGNLIAVVGTDLTLKTLSEFMENLKIGKTGKAFLLNSSGVDLLSQNRDTDLVAKAFGSYSEEKQKDFTFDFNGIAYWGSVHPFVLSKSNQWLILIAVPSDDYFRGIRLTEEESVLMSLAILMIATLLVTYFSNQISVPIVQLAKEADKIRRFELDSTVKIDSRIHEIAMMANSMDAMRLAVTSFGRYIPKEVVKDLIQKGQEIKLGGEKKKITIFFSDITGFTPISESYDPDKLILLLSQYFGEISRTILENQGTVDKFIGDGVMAFWGAPVEVEGQAEKACRTALVCQDFIGKLNEKNRQEGKPQFFTRIGIHTGIAIVGNIGTGEKINYTAVGDPVNIAARLQTVNKVYHTGIIITEETKKEAGDSFLTRPLDFAELKGVAEKKKIYELVALKRAASQDQIELCESFAAAFDLFYNDRLSEAKSLFEKTHNRFPQDYPTQFYLNRFN